jgi:cytochrome c-type biogenesis protein CcmH
MTGRFAVIVWLCLSASVLATPAHALSDPSEMLPNPAQESRAEAVGSQLRCLVCQNESIEDSGADLAKDLRHIVRQRVVAGDSDQQIMDWMVARYGNFVRLSPPFNALTALLWASPLVAVLLAAGVVVAARRARPTLPKPLDSEEQARLRHLLET